MGGVVMKIPLDASPEEVLSELPETKQVVNAHFTPARHSPTQRALLAVRRRKDITWRLVLRNLGWRRLPDELLGLGDCIDSLDLAFNRLQAVPCFPSSLVRLVLDGNPLCRISLKLARLEHLSLNNCSLVSVELATKSLHHLSLNDNPLGKFPSTQNLTNLTHLCLSSCQLTSVPVEVDKLVKLVVLVLDSNLLTEFPAVLCDMPGLVQLDLTRNQINSLPPAIVQMTGLRRLFVSDVEQLVCPDPMPLLLSLN